MILIQSVGHSIAHNVQTWQYIKYNINVDFPDDVKEDWKDAIKEFIHYIMTSEEDNVIKYRNQYINELSEIQYKIL